MQMFRNIFKLWVLISFSIGCQSVPKDSVPVSASPQKMALYWNPVSVKHTRVGQAENHLRTEATQNIISEKHPDIQVVDVAREASQEELAVFHARSYIEEIKNTDGKKVFYRQDRWSPYVTPFGYSAAASAAAATIDLVRDVYSGKVPAGFATVRPPGHHAVVNNPLGFCIFNNIAVAVKNLQLAHPNVKVAILDVDAHHGNGIQDAFYADDKVLYVSVHQDAWPWSGKLEQTGQGKGVGTTVNIPLPSRAGDQAYAEVFTEVIAPAVKRFAPDLIVVAQGYDSHWKDPQTFLAMTSTGQAVLSAKIVSLAQELTQGKVAFVLEGGYQTDVVRDGIRNTVNALSGSKEVFDTMGKPLNLAEPDVKKLLKRIKKIHKL